MNGVRFAPSPTGVFHLGNLRTAWVSERLARALGEPWVVRFEDIDHERVVDGMQEQQLADLADLGLIPDRVDVQSARDEMHFETAIRAVSSGALYPCFCSRREVLDALAGVSSAPHSQEPIYSGKCRRLSPEESLEASERVLKERGSTAIAWRYRVMSDPSGQSDFIAVRARHPWVREGFAPGYHWACGLDDLWGEYRLIVRAWDLESALAPQRAVQSWWAKHVGYVGALPSVFHTTLLVRDDGGRLEKRTLGVTLDEYRQNGGSVRELLRCFNSSFDPVAALKAGAPGEELRTQKVATYL